MPIETIQELRSKDTMISADAQGFIRIRRPDHRLEHVTWPEQQEVLALIDILKADIVEAEALISQVGTQFWARHEVVGELIEESRWLTTRPFAPPAARERMRQDELLFGPRYAHKEKPSFFFKFLLAVCTSLMRQQPFFQALDKNIIKLKPFGGMQRHQ